jgi:ubiquinone/menaquinone biosynthesis C-methylase UbiE
MHTSRELLQLQAEWLSDARSRILRLAEIGRRQSVLDLGCGCGVISQELQQRCRGSVIALDLQFEVLRNLKNAINGDANHLPFKNQSFDLIFTQNVFLWIPQFQNVIQQIHRLLTPAGVYVGIEPDFGGMIEYPAEIESQFLWINGLLRAGADPFIGRKLSAFLKSQHWSIRIELLPRLSPPSADRFKFLEDLPLTSEEQRTLGQITTRSSDIPLENQIVHLPYFLILAERK